MFNDQKTRILIVEDAQGTAQGYKYILGTNYDVTACLTGADVQALIDKGERFDLAIVDVVLPPEDLNLALPSGGQENLKLPDCQETGLRLMETMIKNMSCRKFYVITVRKSLKERAERLCKQGQADLRFEYKLDHEPEEFADNVAQLLAEHV